MATCDNCTHSRGAHDKAGCSVGRWARSVQECGCLMDYDKSVAELQPYDQNTVKLPDVIHKVVRPDDPILEAAGILGPIDLPTHPDGTPVATIEEIVEGLKVSDGPILEAIERLEGPRWGARGTQVGGSHYADRNIQPWDIVDEYDLDFYRGGVLKYLLRAGSKGAKLEDLKKAQHYLARAIEIEESKEE